MPRRPVRIISPSSVTLACTIRFVPMVKIIIMVESFITPRYVHPFRSPIGGCVVTFLICVISRVRITDLYSLDPGSQDMWLRQRVHSRR